MKIPVFAACITYCAATAAFAQPEAPPACAADFSVQVLGSGGPLRENDRASASYLVWSDNHAKIMIDAGAGSAMRFYQSGASRADLDAILLSHLHVDHSADLPAHLKTGAFGDDPFGDRREIAVVGPSGDGAFPGVTEWLDRLIGPQGAYRYLNAYLRGADGAPRLAPREVDIGAATLTRVYSAEGLSAFAHPVRHGAVPALGYLVEKNGKRIVFMGDQNADNEAFESAFGDDGVDLLIAHHSTYQTDGDDEPYFIHRSPRQIGELAAAIGARRVVLAHNFQKSLDRLPSSLAAIAEFYDGSATVAEDLDCFKP